MASTITALASQDCDAFLLRTARPDGSPFTVLFDSGKPGKGLFELIDKSVPDLTFIDVAVCSHNDNDHSGGFAGFIAKWKEQGRAIGSIWLPATFQQVITAFKSDPDSFARELAGDAARYLAAREDGTAPAALDLSRGRQALSADAFWAEIEQATLSDMIEPDPPLLVGRARPEALQWAAFEQAIQRHALRADRFNAATLDGDRVSAQTLARGAAVKTKAIIAIGNAAQDAQFPVRSFDFCMDEPNRPASGGEIGMFQPVNAAEIPPEFGLRAKLVSGAKALFLSMENVESLVFIRPETETEPAVLFNADSRLATGDQEPVTDFPLPLALKPSRPIVFTAAHHASRTNDHAYTVIRNWLGDPLLNSSITIRNGGSDRSRIAGWDAFAKAKRRCVQCVQCDTVTDGGFPMQQIVVSSLGPVWDVNLPGRPCADPKPYEPA